MICRPLQGFGRFANCLCGRGAYCKNGFFELERFPNSNKCQPTFQLSKKGFFLWSGTLLSWRGTLSLWSGTLLLWSQTSYSTKSTLRTMKRYFKVIFCAPHGNKPLKFPWDIWNAVRLRPQIFDSPGVKVYHFAGIYVFRQSNCTLFEMGCAPHFICCQSNRLKPWKESIQNWSRFRTK